MRLVHALGVFQEDCLWRPVVHTLFRMAVNSSAASIFTQPAHHSPTFAARFLFSFVGISDNDANPSGPLDVVVIPSQRMLHG